MIDIERGKSGDALTKHPPSTRRTSGTGTKNEDIRTI